MEDLRSLHDKGLTGVIAFWMVVFNFVFPLCAAAFSIYWLILLGDKVWLQSVGSSLFVSIFFVMFLSLVVIALNFLSTFKIKIVFEQLAFQLFIVLSIVTFIVCCISLSLSSYSSADRAYQDIVDYCSRHSEKKFAVQFFVKHSTFISQKNYVLKRTVEANYIFAGIFGSWLGSFVIYILAFHLLKDKEDAQLLLRHNSQRESNNQIFDGLNQEEEPPNDDHNSDNNNDA